jgi:hypothetical protein
VPVTETFNGQTVWDGEVQVFDLIAHPTAKHAYAWSYATDGTKRKFVAVLQLGPGSRRCYGSSCVDRQSW